MRIVHDGLVVVVVGLSKLILSFLERVA
jgi:hypothetical protein